MDLGRLGDFEKHGRFAEIGDEEIQVEKESKSDWMEPVEEIWPVA